MKGFDCGQWKIKHMNKYIKGFNISKLSAWEKKQGFSEIKLIDNSSQIACLYNPYIFCT